MKKYLISFIIFLFSIAGFGQSLKNTYWYVYDNNSKYFMYFEINSNDIYFGKSPDKLQLLANFTADSTHFSILDVPGMPCSTDTGYYTYKITNDTLSFNLISDSCTNRAPTFTQFYWVTVEYNGIKAMENNSVFNLSPNPVVDELNIRVPMSTGTTHHYRITNLVGVTIKEADFQNELTSIHLSELQKGVYFINIDNTLQKFMKQ